MRGECVRSLKAIRESQGQLCLMSKSKRPLLTDYWLAAGGSVTNFKSFVAWPSA